MGSQMTDTTILLVKVLTGLDQQTQKHI